MDQDLNVRAKTINSYKKTMFHDLGYGSESLQTQKHKQEKKKQINKLNLIKIKIFYASKNIKWEKVFANHISDKGLRSKIQGFPGGTVVESLPANAGDTG